MTGTAGFLAQFFPLFLLGALFGKLMDDSGSVQAIANAMSQHLGTKRAILAVVLAGALITYGGAGKDVQKVGEKVEDKAQDCKDGKC